MAKQRKDGRQRELPVLVDLPSSGVLGKNSQPQSASIGAITAKSDAVARTNVVQRASSSDQQIYRAISERYFKDAK